MAIIMTDHLKPGMVLNSDVRDITGRLLLGAEAKITEKHIHIFRTWGVTEADIQGVTESEAESEAPAVSDPLIVKQAEDELKELFLHVNLSSPVMKELFRLCSMRKIRTLTQENANGS